MSVSCSSRNRQPARNNNTRSRNDGSDPFAAGTITIRIPSTDEPNDAQNLSEDGFSTRSRLYALWTAPGLVEDEKKLIDPQALDLSSMLHDATSQHALLGLTRTVEAALPGEHAQCHKDPSLRRVTCELQLAAGRSLEVSVSCISGRLEFTLLADRGADGANALAKARGKTNPLLADSAVKVNAEPHTLINAWRLIRTEVTLQDLEQKVAYLGLQSCRRLPLADRGELSKHRMSPSFLIVAFLPTAQSCSSSIRYSSWVSSSSRCNDGPATTSSLAFLPR